MKTMAFDFGGTMIKAGLVDDSGNISEFAEVPSNGKQGADALFQAAFAVAERFSGFDRIGISTAGQVDAVRGSIIFANQNIPNYTGRLVADIFADRYHVPVAVENDVNAAALGEAKFGAGRDCPHFICITYGTGIGGGIIIDGKLFRGANGIAGELGHMLVHPGGRLCGCGKNGCYEQYASTTALIKSAVQRDATVTDGRELFRHLDTMSDLVDSWLDEIVLGLVSLVHIMNPHALILGGGIMEQPYIGEKLPQKLYPQLMPSYRSVQIKLAELGNSAGLLGAAWLAQKL